MGAARRQPQQDVVFFDRGAVDDLAFLDDAHGKAGKIVLARRVHARHFGGFPADQRAAGLPASGGDAFDDLGRGGDVELAARVIVEEEQRLGPLGQDVVHAHRHEIDADRIVAAELHRELQLGAHPVGAGDQDRLAIIVPCKFEQCAEAADAGEHPLAQRFPGKRLDVLDEPVAGVDVHAGIAVGEGLRFGFVSFLHCALETEVRQPQSTRSSQRDNRKTPREAGNLG